MSAEEIVDAEIVGTDIAVREAAPPPTLFGTDDPDAFISKASHTAGALANVVRSQKLVTWIGSSEHVRVEGWTLLGSMLGVYASTEWTRPLEDGWEARVVAHNRDGLLVGAAEAQCTRAESTWENRDDYALRSMAQTRATSKALRQPLGFVMQLAGFNPTPAEEMPRPSRQESTPSNREYSAPAEEPRSQFVAPTVREQPAGTMLASDVVCPMGKNAGTRIGDMSRQQLGWYVSDEFDPRSPLAAAFKKAARAFLDDANALVPIDDGVPF